MKQRYLLPALLLGLVAVPTAVRAQHTRGADSPSVGTAVPSGGSSSSGASSGGSASSGGGETPRQFEAGGSNGPGRRRGSRPATGTAVPRGSVAGGGGAIIIGDGSGFYPWGFGYGGVIAGGFWDGDYGAYDPWYGWFPTYAPAADSSSPDDSGAVRLKVKPSDASVYVDGYYAGVVDDFDGAFQRLRLEPGPHRLEIRAQNYQPLSVDVMIQEDLTITYRGELAR